MDGDPVAVGKEEAVYHEAGHATVSALARIRFRQVRVFRRGYRQGWTGRCSYRWEIPAGKREWFLVSTLAGPIAPAVALGIPVDWDQDDTDNAASRALRLSEELGLPYEEYMRCASASARLVLTWHLRALNRVAEALARHGALDYAQVRRLVTARQHSQRQLDLEVKGEANGDG